MNTALEPIDPYDDPRVTHKYADVRGRKYHYVEGFPKGTPKATIICIHGFPDFWYGWRATIPFLLQEGLHVIVPDMMGYGGTDSPNVPPESIEVYGFKHTADDIAALLKILGIPKVILLGHDWGGVVVGRIHLHHPELVTHIVSIVTPYLPVNEKYVPLEKLVEILPNFTYQLALVKPETEKKLQEKENISRFFRAMLRVKGSGGKRLQVGSGIVESLGDQPRCESILSQKDLDYYVDTFYGKENKFHGPLNWYKTREQNFEDEKHFFGTERSHIHIPYLFIGGTNDVALPPAMWDGQEKFLHKFTFRVLPTSHWAMVEDPVGCHKHLKEWFDKEVFAGCAAGTGSGLKL